MFSISNLDFKSHAKNELLRLYYSILAFHFVKRARKYLHRDMKLCIAYLQLSHIYSLKENGIPSFFDKGKPVKDEGRDSNGHEATPTNPP